MVPGYTGYIPKSEKYFGDRFAVICDHATNDIIGQNERYRNSKLNQARQVLPSLHAQSECARKYKSKEPCTDKASPYFAKDDKQKSFISGYTGFIPHARSRYANGYPGETREALVSSLKRQQELN